MAPDGGAECPPQRTGGHGRGRARRRRPCLAAEGSAIFQILALAVILAINNFFGAVSLGAAPLARRQRIGVVALFAASDCGLPLVGVLLGAGLARALGPVAADIGVALIMLTGLYLGLGVLRPAAGAGHAAPSTQMSVGPLVVTSLALGLDNLGAAVGLGATGVNVPLALVTFAVVTGVVTALGLAVGGFVHRRLSGRAATGLAGVLLFGTGATMLVARLHGG